MLNLPPSLRIYMATEPTDMRRGFNGLQGQVSGVLQQDPLSGHLFLFVNRRRDRLKILYWDVDGLAIWYKRLESGTFQLPNLQPDQTKIEIRSDELMMLLRGIDLSSKRRKRYCNRSRVRSPPRILRDNGKMLAGSKLAKFALGRG